MDETDDWVTVARSLTPTEAHLWGECLRAAGLEVMVADANLVQTHSLIGVAVGGVRVMVPASQADEAQAVLEAFHRGDFSLPEDEPPQ
ncbi:DUF2007 domain-containing protein [Nitrogeniibacter mangrovi]|uniref:DUF2007 domain-containing protein n=1 Tax=Nitrogeniibacter mangrovi TaxID=2016596 RepID=A0A6C1B0Z0_9RHOO|nr:DUF2007 domain-containing protein [Nitrogeniibacter mangrovi]QID17237.1 DUF2007 domain-containing protein [Nitrogeniibacter mangrovi]